MTRPRSEIDMHELLYKLACDYPKIPGTEVAGIKALAQIMGMSANTLRNKLSPDVDTHKVSFEEASAIMELCSRAGMANAFGPLMAMNWRHGLVAFDREEFEQDADECIHRGASEVLQHVGAMAGTVNEALADQHICPKEMEKIESRFRVATSKFYAWFSRIRTRAKKDSLRRPLFRAAPTTTDSKVTA